MKYLFKKFWWLFTLAVLINIPLLVFGCIRTDKTVTLKGDTTIVEEFVTIDNPHSQKGSFSTIYVISLDHCTMLQSFIVGASKTSEVSDLPKSYLHFSQSELNQMGVIQHDSSINYSLIQAYKEAEKIDSKIQLKYILEYIQVDYYSAGSDFRIGDKIIKINGFDIEEDQENFQKEMNERMRSDDIYVTKTGDEFTVLRGENTIEITCTEPDILAAYYFYKIDSATAFPKFKIIPTNVGGPSGGLLQTLALYNCLVEEDITKGRKIAGTGTIDVNGKVGPIGGIQQKIYTAFDDDIEIFLCPKDNYEEALIAYNKLPNKNMKLYSIESFAEALEVLKDE